MEVKKITEGMTATQVAEVIDSNFRGVREETDAKLSELGLEISYVTGFVEYGFIYPVNGEISNPNEPDVNHNRFVNTGYLKIDRRKKIVFRADTANKYNLALAYYDSDKNFISGLSNITTDDTEIITIESENIPSNTKYIVVSKKVESNNAFVAFTPDYSISHDFIIDIPKGKNLYNKFYSDYVSTDKIIDSNNYILHGVKRDKNESHITISYNPEGSWDCMINFYDTNFKFLSSVQGSANNTFIIPNDTEYIIFKTFGHNILYDYDFMINYGEEILPFEDFNSSIGQYVQLKDLKQNIQSISAIHSYQFGLIGFINNKGEVFAENEGNSDFRSTSLLHIAKDSEIYFKGDSTNEYINVIAFYDINKKFISGLSKIDEKEKTIHKLNYSELPEGTKYIRVCRRKNDTTAFVSYSQFEQTHFDYIIDIPKGNNLYNINNKYTEINNSTVYQIPTAILRDNNQDKIILSNRISAYYLLVYFYDADYTLISKVNNLQVGNVINIPETCKYITFLDYGDSLKKGGTMVNYGEELLPYEEYSSILVKDDKKTKINNRSFSAKLDSLTNGSLSIDVPNVKYNQTIGFFAKVNNFGKITLSHGKQNYAAGMVDIDSTNIITYTTTPQVAETYPHGLNINTYIEVLISQTDTTTAMLYIRTLGGEFSKEIPFIGSRDNVLCEAENCDLRNCLLTHTSSDYKKEIWAFGDSYFDYIPLRLKEIKHNNALFDAFSGRNSSDALKSLKKMVGVVGIPKIIYWALGMNDKDSDSSVNSSWNNVFNELKIICENYSIELILATIPNVSTVNNRFKNEIVRNSGYRYVDNSMYVGADISDYWYNGLQGSDKIHPSNEGAKVLANGLAISIPELKL